MQTNTGNGWVWYLLAGPNASCFLAVLAPVSDDTAWVWRDIVDSAPEGEDCNGMGLSAGCVALNGAAAVALDAAGAAAAAAAASDAAAAALDAAGAGAAGAGTIDSAADAAACAPNAAADALDAAGAAAAGAAVTDGV